MFFRAGEEEDKREEGILDTWGIPILTIAIRP